MTTDQQVKEEQQQEEQTEVLFMSKLQRPKYVMQPRKRVKQSGEEQEAVYIVFENYTYRTDDKDEVEFLRGHDDYGNEFWEKDEHDPEEVEKNEGVDIDVQGMEQHEEEVEQEVQSLKDRMDNIEEKFEETTNKIVDKLDQVAGSSEEEADAPEEEEEEQEGPKNVVS